MASQHLAVWRYLVFQEKDISFEGHTKFIAACQEPRVDWYSMEFLFHHFLLQNETRGLTARAFSFGVEKQPG